MLIHLSRHFQRIDWDSWRTSSETHRRTKDFTCPRIGISLVLCGVASWAIRRRVVVFPTTYYSEGVLQNKILKKKGRTGTHLCVSVRIHGRKWKEDGIVGRRRKKQNSQVLRVGSLIYKYTPKKEEGEDKRKRKSRGCRKYKKYFQGPIFRCEPTYSAITDWPTKHGINGGGKSVCRLFHPDIECFIWSMHARHNIIILKKEKEWREEVKGPHANDGRLCRRCACATAGEESLSSCAINSHPRGCSGCSPLTECARGEGGGEISRDPLRGAAAPAAAWVVKVCLCTGWGIQIFFSFSILYFGRLCFTVTSATSSSSCSLPPPLEEEEEEL
jgi:hypothetical protein